MFEQVDDASMAEIDQLFANILAQHFFLNHEIILVDRSLLPSATKLRRLCFYRRLSVHRGGGGVCLSAYWDTTHTHTHPQKQTPPQSRPPRTRYPPDQTPPWSRHPTGSDTPPPKIRPLLRTVRILLECILVQRTISLH